jgi:DNA (cytosine-5)-methyltransferase 1
MICALAAIGATLVFGGHTYSIPFKQSGVDWTWLRDKSYTGAVAAQKVCDDGFAYKSDGTCQRLAVPASAVVCPAVVVAPAPGPVVPPAQPAPPPLPAPSPPVGGAGTPLPAPAPVPSAVIPVTIAPAYWANSGPPPYGDAQLQRLAKSLTDYFALVSYGRVALDVKILPLRKLSMNAPAGCPGAATQYALQTEAFPGMPYARHFILVETPACGVRQSTNGYWMFAFGSLFSGIGGFELGLERAGMRCIWQSEIDPYASAVLRKHWPEVPNHGDIRNVRAGVVERPDVICGGFPCQDISNAGKRAGIDGERSGLWSEYARVIGELRPRYVIVENVAALLGRGLERVLGDLAALGFDAEWHCIPASAVGAPHRRDRRLDCGPRHRRGVVGADVADAERQRQQGPRQPFHAGDSAARLTRQAVDAFNGCGRDQWRTEPDVGRGFDGLPVWLDRYVGRGMSHAESRRAVEALRELWTVDVSRALRRAAGGLERLEQAQVLFSFLREYENGTHEARLLVEGAQASEAFLRSLRDRAAARGASRRPGPAKQRGSEHPDAVQPVSRLLARDSEATWAGGGWEDATPRVAQGVADRVARLRCLGNAIVPQVAEVIGRAVMESERGAGMSDDRKALVERLRTHWHGTFDQEESPCATCHAAADMIERLQPAAAAQGEAEFGPVDLTHVEPDNLTPSVPAAQDDARDAARFRWLTDDDADEPTFKAQRALIARMAVMSRSAVCMYIDARLAGQGEQAGGEQG